MTAFDPRSIKALVCDVFGTVVDWRASIIREGELLASAKGLNVDWAAFADAWRAGYPKAMDRVRRGELPWTRIDDLHRMILDELLLRFDLRSLNADEVDQLNRVWHRLTPWPDSVAGLQRLRSRFVVATLSNGNVSLLVNMAKHAGLPWDCILSAEIFHRYKPDLEVYRQAADMLGYAPDQVLMVAAHPSDLRAAREAGLKTAYVMRPLEYGAGRRGEDAGDDRFDVVANDLGDLAEKLAI
jgi:2-haloacid dehalogenase